MCEDLYYAIEFYDNLKMNMREDGFVDYEEDKEGFPLHKDTCLEYIKGIYDDRAKKGNRDTKLNSDYVFSTKDYDFHWDATKGERKHYAVCLRIDVFYKNLMYKSVSFHLQEDFFDKIIKSWEDKKYNPIIE